VTDVLAWDLASGSARKIATLEGTPLGLDIDGNNVLVAFAKKGFAVIPLNGAGETTPLLRQQTTWKNQSVSIETWSPPPMATTNILLADDLIRVMYSGTGFVELGYFLDRENAAVTSAGHFIGSAGAPKHILVERERKINKYSKADSGLDDKYAVARECQGFMEANNE
jgi:hypothetical protein